MSINYKYTPIQLKNGKTSLLEEFDSVQLPFEILNIIFSYLEGKTNQIIKNAVSEFYIKSDFKESFWFFIKIRASFIAAKQNISWYDASNDEISIEKYFKYSFLHIDRKKIIKQINTNIKKGKIVKK